MQGTTFDAASLRPLLARAAELDLTDPAAVRATLEQEFPLDGPLLTELREALLAGVEAGTVCHKGEAPMRFSRLQRPDEASFGFSVDAVLMNGPGPKHRHPRGEIDLCFAIEGEPRFDGQAPGWVIYGPDSQHVPTVSGGTMLIVYLLPEGAFELLDG